jgi:chromosome segregation ATPase
MTTKLEQAQRAVAQAEEALRSHEHRNHELRAQRSTIVASSDTRALAMLDGQISDCDTATRLARAHAQEAQEQLSVAESAIAQARGLIGSLQSAVAECERLAARARQQVAIWEGQCNQKLTELSNARAALASLMGVAVEELDEVLVETMPASPAEPATLVPSPRLRPAPRLVIEYGVKRYFDDAAGQEVAVDGTPLVG